MRLYNAVETVLDCECRGCDRRRQTDVAGYNHSGEMHGYR